MRALLPPAFLALPAAALALVLAAAACSGRVDHLFGGYAYDATNDCLYTSGAIDVIAGADPGTCAMLRCWVAPDGSTYVTDAACDAPLDYQDQTKSGSGPCVKALAAYARTGHDLCAAPPDGGTGGGAVTGL